MNLSMTSLRTRTAAVPLAVLLGGAGLTGCSNDTAGAEAGADVESIQEEPEVEPVAEEVLEDGVLEDGVLVYGDDFTDAASYVGETVTVSADVSEIIAAGIFTIAGTENTTLEPLRIVADPTVDVQEDVAVQVTGTVYQYDPDALTEVEELLGDDVDAALFEDVENGEPYVVATDVSPVVE